MGTLVRRHRKSNNLYVVKRYSSFKAREYVRVFSAIRIQILTCRMPWFRISGTIFSSSLRHFILYGSLPTHARETDIVRYPIFLPSYIHKSPRSCYSCCVRCTIRNVNYIQHCCPAEGAIDATAILLPLISRRESWRLRAVLARMVSLEKVRVAGC